jgi:predicted short-subunit dehydrogenase-like oxidoreductase (DUF2520 family)
MLPVKHIVLLGAGNLAVHLSRALARKGYAIVQVYNRTAERGRKMARLFHTEYTANLSTLIPDADLYILVVSDSAIAEVAAGMKIRNGLVVHTSGSVPLQALAGTSVHYGVFYPLQTFRGARRITFSNIPVCVEANSPDGEATLVHLAGQLTTRICRFTSEQRLVLHLAAVFAGNFSNFMYAIAEELLQQHGIPFDLLKPLIRQTTANIDHPGLFSRQTGPAVREELRILEAHRDLLEEFGDYREIYHLISNSIIRQKRQHDQL